MDETNPYASLAHLLGALASPTRLELLHALREPQTVTDVRVGASLSREGERPERPLTRQAVAYHVEQLQALGLLRRVEADGRDRFVLDHAGVFGLFEELRSLTRLRPFAPAPRTETVAHPPAPVYDLPPTPRLLTAYGSDTRIAYPLAPPASRWPLGRNADCAVQLDHDPYVSGVHAVVERHDDRFTLTDLGSRNGTWVDWRPALPDRPLPLQDGALLTVGRTMLVFQARPHAEP